jgi:hypothetical protein
VRHRTFDIFDYRRSFIRAAPLALAVPVLLGITIIAAGAAVDPGAILAGIVGWSGALALRAPLARLVSRGTQHDRMRADPIIAVTSGVVEEVVRLGAVVTVGLAAPRALWVGLGWGLAEALFAVISGAAILALIGSDPERDQEISLIPLRDQTRSDSPLWGVIERIWKTGLHIGWTLLIAVSPILVVVTILAHAATELALLLPAVRMGLPRLQLIGLAWAAVTLWVASIAWAALAP